MEPEPTNLEEWLCYVLKHEDGIFVRDKNAEGKWDSLALSEISNERWAHWVSRWLEEGRLPVRVRTDEEIAADL